MWLIQNNTVCSVWLLLFTKVKKKVRKLDFFPCTRFRLTACLSSVAFPCHYVRVLCNQFTCYLGYCKGFVRNITKTYKKYIEQPIVLLNIYIYIRIKQFQIVLFECWLNSIKYWSVIFLLLNELFSLIKLFNNYVCLSVKSVTQQL